MFHKRKYTPANPQKYAGDPTIIFMRSSWETRFALWCDHNPNVVKWVSEEIVIPYRCPTDNKIHRYFVDFKLQIKDKDGNLLQSISVDMDKGDRDNYFTFLRAAVEKHLRNKQSQQQQQQTPKTDKYNK